MPDRAAFLLVMVVGLAGAPAGLPGQAGTSTPAGSAGSGRAPLTWNDVAASYERVRDYTCTYEKEERAIEHGERQVIGLFFRKPLDIRLEWHNQKGKVDQIAVYRQGFNDGKLLARRSGVVGGVVGTLKLDLHDSLALEDSRHPITEVGIGSLIERAAQDAHDGHVTIRPVVEDTLDGRPVDRFEFEAAPGAQLVGLPGARRGLVWVDLELKLPVKVEIRDGSGTVLERHRFKDLRLNVGLTDKTFSL